MDDIEDLEEQIEEYKERIEDSLKDFDGTNAIDRLNKVKSIKQSIENMSENLKMYRQFIQRLSMGESNSELMQKHKDYVALVAEYRKEVALEKNKLKNEGELLNYDESLEDTMNILDEQEQMIREGLNIQAKSKSKLEAIK
mmetsp:Transcript_12233/g.12270  ORF Transcript_12233/g.12270 Transcript_12233/m.12270 type:complete len:141 (-) Transcript_12233:292-714(-)